MWKLGLVGLLAMAVLVIALGAFILANGDDETLGDSVLTLTSVAPPAPTDVSAVESGTGTAAATRQTTSAAEPWGTYVNAEFEYEISFPADWSTQIRDPEPGDDSVGQWIRATGAEGSVLASVNFQGGWCAGTEVSSHEIVVSGVQGTEWECGGGSGLEWVQIVRHFEISGEPNYTVIGESETGDTSVIREILESFRFLE